MGRVAPGIAGRRMGVNGPHNKIKKRWDRKATAGGKAFGCATVA